MAAMALRVAALAALLALCPAPGAPFAVVGYLPEWRYLNWPAHEQAYRWDALAEHMTHLILFSIEVGPGGQLAALDRLPPKATMAYATRASQLTPLPGNPKAHGCQLIICFGGNSRTGAFPQMVASAGLRAGFLDRLGALCREYGFGGVDYNWEYPQSEADWQGLAALVAETRARFGPEFFISLAYYPDGRQERNLARLLAPTPEAVDLLHMMSYDQPGRHATWGFGKQSVDQGKALLAPASRLTMGLPFYSRHIRSGHWKTYEDLARTGSLDGRPDLDQLGGDYFNGAALIERKTRYALDQGLGGVMVWEVGQDHFSNADRALAPDALLLAISRARQAAGPASGEHREL